MKPLLPLACILFLAVPACTAIHPGIDGNAGVSAPVACRDFTRIAKTLESILADEGYSAIPSGNSQMPIYGSPARPHLSYQFGNGRRIWFIMQPRSDGWLVQALPEPEGTDTWFPRRQVSRVLQTLQARCENSSP